MNVLTWAESLIRRCLRRPRPTEVDVGPDPTSLHPVTLRLLRNRYGLLPLATGGWVQQNQPLVDEVIRSALRPDPPAYRIGPSIAVSREDLDHAQAAFLDATRAGRLSHRPAQEPERIPNIRFTDDLVELGNAGHALAVEAGLVPGVQIVNDGMPLWFEAVGDGTYTWHFIAYVTDDDGAIMLADPDEPREPATASRAVLVTADQVDRYYEAITIREGATA